MVVLPLGGCMYPLDLVKLTALMSLTSGLPEVTIGLIDGPVAMDHPDLAVQNIREVPGGGSTSCSRVTSAACRHGTFVAGILSAKRGCLAPAICPGCSLLVRPIFHEPTSETARSGSLGRQNETADSPSATPEDLAAAIITTVDAGARLLNMSVGLAQPSSKGARQLEQALDYAVQRGVIAVAAAGNQGTVGSSALTRHPRVIPVAGCDLRGRPAVETNLGTSIGRRGLSAPAESITSLGADGRPLTIGGTSAAVPFVTGAIALLWSEFPTASADQVKFAITQSYAPRRPAIVPPVLDALAAYQFMLRRG